MWIWQQTDWPSFYWDKTLIESMVRQTRLNQGILLGKMTSQALGQDKSMLDTLLANIVYSSAIEGEKLNAFSVRSSLANKLGLTEERPFPTTVQTDGLAEITLDAVDNLDIPLTLERILHWHDRLFPSGYTILDQTQKGGLDITPWLIWFFNTLNEMFNKALKEIEQTVFKTNFWRSVDQTKLAKEQVKVLNRMLDGDFADGINTSQYHQVAKVSKPTATRHLTALVEQGCLVKFGAGRSTRYRL